MIDGEEYDADYEDEGGYHGDDELDQYVEEYYGDDYNWVLLGQHQGYDIHLKFYPTSLFMTMIKMNTKESLLYLKQKLLTLTKSLLNYPPTP